VLRHRGEDDEQRELDDAQRRRDTPDQLGDVPFQALQASAHFDRVLYDGAEFGASAAEEEFLGLPGLLEPEQVALLLRKRQADQLRKHASGSGPGRYGTPAVAAPGTAAMASGGGAKTGGTRTGGTGGAGTAARGTAAPAARETLAALRKELNGLIAAWHHRTGQQHGAIHSELRRACGGPSLPEATGEQIRARIETVRRWAASGRSGSIR
jgi:hypothetical protein